MYPIKLGIIGCGIAARELHWPALKELRDKFEIIMVCNHTEEKAKSFAELAGGVQYALDYHELLKNSEVEAVDIILPIEMNCKTIEDSLLAGKHVIAEKPLASSLADGRRIIEFAGKFPLVSMIAENYRYRDVFARIKKIIADGAIGRAMSVFWNCFDLIDSNNNKFVNTNWRIHHKYPGGFPVDAGIHNVAALRDIFGELTGKSSFSNTFNPAIGDIDSLSWQFTTESGVNGVFNIFFSSDGFRENRLIILGKNGSIILNNNELTVKKGETIISEEKFENSMGFKEEFIDFYEAVRNGRQVKSSLFEAYCDLKGIFEAVTAAYLKQGF